MRRLDPAERKVIRRIVADALTLGFEVEVKGGPDGAPDCSRSFLPELIFPAVGLGPETCLLFYRAHERDAFGWVRLAHGRGGDVVSGSSDASSVRVILERALARGGRPG